MYSQSREMNEWMDVNTMEPFGITINEIFISHVFLRRMNSSAQKKEHF